MPLIFCSAHELHVLGNKNLSNCFMSQPPDLLVVRNSGKMNLPVEKKNRDPFLRE